MPVIRPTEADDASQVEACSDRIARERRYVGNTKGFSVEQTREFIQFVKKAGGVHLVVLDGDAVVGWCDITPHAYEGLTHVGRLGMGLLSDYRRQGWGTKLVSEALKVAFEKDLERIELEVFASNAGAIKLYQNFGFCEEGCKRDARKLDGQYDDIVMFGLLRKNWDA